MDEHRSMPWRTDDQPELPQLTGGHKLPDVSLSSQATDGQPELPQITDGAREARILTALVTTRLLLIGN